MSKYLDTLGDIFPTSLICPAHLRSETFLYREFGIGLPMTGQARELLNSTNNSSSSFNLKGAVMDMMWLFAAVMGALLLGGIIVYKKSV